MLEKVEDGLFVHVPGRITYRNPNLPDALRNLEPDSGAKWFDSYELFEVTDGDLVPIEHGHGPVAKALAGERVENRLYFIRQRATGLERYYEVTCRKYRIDPGDTEGGYSLYTRDVTKHVKSMKGTLLDELRQTLLLDLAAPASLILDRSGRLIGRRGGSLPPVESFDPRAAGAWHDRFEMRKVGSVETSGFLETLVWPLFREYDRFQQEYDIHCRDSGNSWCLLVNGRRINAGSIRRGTPASDLVLLTFSPVLS